jgi:hypothetical protein
MKLSCNAGISIGDFRAVTANHHRQTGAFVYEREKISQFFTGLGKNITFNTGDLIALITISHPRTLSPSWHRVGSYYFLIVVVIIRYEPTAAARWASLFIIRTFFNNAFTITVWARFLRHVDASASLACQSDVITG